jgi:hypothetical protein
MRRKLEVLTAVNLIGRNANKAMVESGGVCVWREFDSDGWLCVGTFGRNLASVAVKTFSSLAYFIKRFYKFRALNAI